MAAVDRCLSVSDSSDNVALTRRLVCESRLDWIEVVSWANKHLVAPALWTKLSQPAFCELLPQDVRNYLSFLHARNAARNERIRLQCLEIGLNLARAGLRVALLKGVAWLFDGNWLAASDRMMRDIDLAAPEEFEPAVRALEGSGYREMSGIYIEVGHFHHAPMVCEGGEASVEIHRDLANRIELLSSAEVIASAREVAPGLLLPESRHRIVHNVIHAQILNGNFIGGIVDLRDGLDRRGSSPTADLISTGPVWLGTPLIAAIFVIFPVRFMPRTGSYAAPCLHLFLIICGVGCMLGVAFSSADGRTSAKSLRP